MSNADKLRTVKVEKSEELKDLIKKYQQLQRQTEECRKQEEEQVDKV